MTKNNGDFEVHPVGTGKRLADSEREALLLKSKLALANRWIMLHGKHQAKKPPRGA